MEYIKILDRVITAFNFIYSPMTSALRGIWSRVVVITETEVVKGSEYENHSTIGER